DSVLVAHQLVGPKINRFIALIQHFPTTKFAAIIDNTDSLLALEKEAMNSNVSIDVYIDINNGMDRTGIEIGQGLNELIDQIKPSNTLKFKGLHVYDGQFRDSDYDDRHAQVEGAMQQVLKLYEDLKNESKELELVCGGTPTFSSHLFHAYRICSPGTCVFWDWGYDEKLSEQNFQYAVLIVTRIISKPTEGIITIDLGHKSVGSENPIDKRVKFLNLSNYSLKSQSEEHGVLEVDNWDELKVGEVLFGVPFHICPTVNLHDAFSVISNGKKVDQWQIAGRQRKITI
ncbi:MAG: D-TA family PLP-dependent enzyme, partial [Flavobacteriaceae bacterium]|nr:D-TA family PLP-dependent enzyme [Flavobacteriaceae bacterium]